MPSCTWGRSSPARTSAASGQLPDLLNRATNVDTFRRRFATRKLTLFTDVEVTDALLTARMPDGITFATDAAARLAELVGGDPYLFQYVGHTAWDLGTGPTVDTDDIVSADTATYAERLRIVEAASEDVPASETEVLDALYAVAGTGDTARGADVAQHLGKTLPQIATPRAASSSAPSSCANAAAGASPTDWSAGCGRPATSSDRQQATRAS